MPETISSRAIAACARVVETATAQCTSPAQPIVTTAPDYSAVALSITGLATAFTWGTFLFGALALVGGFGWAWFIKLRAEKIAADTAKELAEQIVRDWLATEGPAIARKHVEIILDSTLGPGDDLGRVDKRDSQAGRVLIQDCFLRSSYGSRGFVGRGMGGDRAAVAA